ncbi:MAG: bifunctional DNA-formamidopyrimidine glycosylase/DNA-(apurinic or apyrimidinic site) lyase [Betaproteobacteria bacterium]|nr:bifunctional DNA-formamidopyrimidine glycosylase/DNA-(apurinic or apyrimidinic site) lyase [Betaproteobacteria bacterium]
MPELPEVETVRRGLAPYLAGRRLLGARVREPRLRWPVSADLSQRVAGQRVLGLERRGKYLLMRLEQGGLLLHLGMSGSLQRVRADTPPARHDHLDLLLDDGACLRLHDPRRFGAVLWSADPATHPLIAALGVEPLTPAFDGARLHALSRGRKTAIKHFLMDAHQVVGVGNIYANEALFRAGVDPRLPAGRLSRPRCERLVGAIKATLLEAIEAGGSSLRDFVDSQGRHGWFQQSYFVYGRSGEPCRICGGTIRHLTQGARSTFLCNACQKR